MFGLVGPIQSAERITFWAFALTLPVGSESPRTLAIGL